MICRGFKRSIRQRGEQQHGPDALSVELLPRLQSQPQPRQDAIPTSPWGFMARGGRESWAPCLAVPCTAPRPRRSLPACLRLLRQTVCSCHVQGNPVKVYKGLELNGELVKTALWALRLCGSKSEVCPGSLHTYLFYGSMGVISPRSTFQENGVKALELERVGGTFAF